MVRPEIGEDGAITRATSAVATGEVLPCPKGAVRCGFVANGRTDEGEEEALQEDRQQDHDNPRTG